VRRLTVIVLLSAWSFFISLGCADDDEGPEYYVEGIVTDSVRSVPLAAVGVQISASSIIELTDTTGSYGPTIIARGLPPTDEDPVEIVFFKTGFVQKRIRLPLDLNVVPYVTHLDISLSPSPGRTTGFWEGSLESGDRLRMHLEVVPVPWTGWRRS
jgi:hypothetical protein